jgi:hypothetical protein
VRAVHLKLNGKQFARTIGDGDSVLRVQRDCAEEATEEEAELNGEVGGESHPRFIAKLQADWKAFPFGLKTSARKNAVGSFSANGVPGDLKST